MFFEHFHTTILRTVKKKKKLKIPSGRSVVETLLELFTSIGELTIRRFYYILFVRKLVWNILNRPGVVAL